MADLASYVEQAAEEFVKEDNSVTEFDCVNHDKWKELKMEEIRTDNTETLINALERIAELEKENAELKERLFKAENAYKRR